jgi:hypothetical protein
MFTSQQVFIKIFFVIGFNLTFFASKNGRNRVANGRHPVAIHKQQKKSLNLFRNYLQKSYHHKYFLFLYFLRASPRKITFSEKNFSILKGPFDFWTFLKCPFLKKVRQT